MLQKEFFGLLFLGFIAWIFVASNPSQRIERGCEPIGWGGNVITSMSALVLPDQQTTVQGWFDKMEYSCRYLTWRLFYQDDYNKYIAQQKAAVEKALAEKAAADKVAKEGTSDKAGEPKDEAQGKAKGDDAQESGSPLPAPVVPVPAHPADAR